MASGEPIAAIATPCGRGGIGIVRLSGRDLKSIAHGVLGKLPKPRHATLAEFRDRQGRVIDQGIALYFPAPGSYTGEEVLELQGHGGMAVLSLLLSRCLELGARLAEPGEFSKRAFLNGKLDLSQAESVADLIDASTAEAARSAMRSLKGEFSGQVRHMVDQLVELRALTEATLDFPDEEIDFLKAADAYGRLDALRSALQQVLATAQQGALLREGAQVVLVGRPNVGKSSILNKLARDEVAIVTDVPGTTRDAIRQSVDINGVPFHVIDTAGLRATEDAVEKIGIARTRAMIDQADIALLVVEASAGGDMEDRAIVESLPPALPRLKVYNKIDLTGDEPGVCERETETEIYVSAKSGAGVDLLRGKLLEMVGWKPAGEGLFMARARHLKALQEALDRLEAGAGAGSRLELLAEELRLAQQALGAITGEFTADDLLGEIFSRFCIGK